MFGILKKRGAEEPAEDQAEKAPAVHVHHLDKLTNVEATDSYDSEHFYSLKKADVHRGLLPRHIQLIGIGGTIGTALFVQIASAFHKGGPGSLLVAFSAWCLPIICLTFTTAEMITQFPIVSPFTSLAGRFFDEAMEVASGWNFFILQATLVPFEITSVTYIIEYWRSDFNLAAVIVPQIGLYVIINTVMPVRWFGEVEFWLSIMKVILITGLLLFTFITMLGGNPLHDAYGFRFWDTPGSFLEYFYDGSVGRFLGFAACFSQAAYTVAGPDYVSMAAGEAMNPRKTLPRAYKAVLWRLSAFFILGTLAMGIVCAADDPLLVKALAGGDSTASASPYVIAMQRLHISGLPSVVNVGLIISAFSAGNSYFYCASRSLHAMALKGHAPSFFKWCLPNGVPIIASSLVVAVSMLSFLQLGNSANQVLTWIVSIGTPAELANYALMSATYLRFFFAMKAQKFDRNKLYFKSWFQPYTAFLSLFAMFSMTWLAGWAVFLNGNWSMTAFATRYVIIPFDILVYIFWKLWKHPKMPALKELDLVSGLEEIDQHEREYKYIPPQTWPEKVFRFIICDF